MPAKTYLEQAKSILARSRVLRAVPIAMMAAAAAHAIVPTTPPTFSLPISISGGATTGNANFNCSGGAGSMAPPTGGAILVSSSHGISLNGTGILRNSGFPACGFMLWGGSGSGQFTTTTLPGAWNFTITKEDPNIAVEGWEIFFEFNAGGSGAAAMRARRSARRQRAVSPRAPSSFTCTYPNPNQTDCVCTGPGCGGTQTASNVPLAVPNGQSFANWDVGLAVGGNWPEGSVTNMVITVPPGTSIDINPGAPVQPPAAVPAPSALVLTILGFGALALGRVFVKHSKTA